MKRLTKKTDKLPRDAALQKLREELTIKLGEHMEDERDCLQRRIDSLFKGVVESITAFREVTRNLRWPLAGPTGEAIDIMQGGTFELPKYGYGDQPHRDLTLQSFRISGHGLGELNVNCDGAYGAAMVGRLMTGKREVQPGKYRWAFIAVRVDDDEKKGG